MFHSVTTEHEIDEIVKIARVIWTQHYTPIIGIKQVEYMLENLHSKEVISKQILHENYQYFLIKKDKQVVGYIGVQLKAGELFLSKLYVASSERGQGFGKAAIQHVIKIALDHKLPKITLTVNIHNTNSIFVYEKMGFVKTGTACVDIGEGYVMDDFLMERLVS